MKNAVASDEAALSHRLLTLYIFIYCENVLAICFCSRIDAGSTQLMAEGKEGRKEIKKRMQGKEERKEEKRKERKERR